jgi:hypothetical protein
MQILGREMMQITVIDLGDNLCRKVRNDVNAKGAHDLSTDDGWQRERVNDR